MIALVVSAWFGEYFIKWMKRHHISETQRDASVDPFGVQKINVPSMGGIIIIVSVLVPCLLLGRLRNIYMILMLVTTVWLGLLGFLDDYIKIFKKNKDGLAGRFKILGQVTLGLLVGLVLYFSPDAVVRENVEVQHQSGVRMEVVHKSQAVKSTQTTIPFVKGNNLDYTEIMSFCGKYKTQAADSLRPRDHLCHHGREQRRQPQRRHGRHGGGKLGHHLHRLGHSGLRVEPHRLCSYLNIMYIPGSQELVIYICAMVGALIGFLWYNAIPPRFSWATRAR